MNLFERTLKKMDEIMNAEDGIRHPSNKEIAKYDLGLNNYLIRMRSSESPFTIETLVNAVSWLQNHPQYALVNIPVGDIHWLSQSRYGFNTAPTEPMEKLITLIGTQLEALFIDEHNCLVLGNSYKFRNYGHDVQVLTQDYLGNTSYVATISIGEYNTHIEFGRTNYM